MMQQVYDWRNPAEIFKGDILFRWRDLITGDILGISVKDWSALTYQAVSTVEGRRGEERGPEWLVRNLWDAKPSTRSLRLVR
jgi:hypothetical protein